MESELSHIRFVSGTEINDRESRIFLVQHAYLEKCMIVTNYMHMEIILHKSRNIGLCKGHPGPPRNNHITETAILLHCSLFVLPSLPIASCNFTCLNVFPPSSLTALLPGKTFSSRSVLEITSPQKMNLSIYFFSV